MKLVSTIEIYLIIPKWIPTKFSLLKLLKEWNSHRCSHCNFLKLSASSNYFQQWFKKYLLRNNVNASRSKESRYQLVSVFLNTVWSPNIPNIQGGTNSFRKVYRNEITSKRDIQMTLVFDISKTYQKEISKQPRVFVFQKHIKISRRSCINFPSELHQIISKQHRFFVHQN